MLTVLVKLAKLTAFCVVVVVICGDVVLKTLLMVLDTCELPRVAIELLAVTVVVMTLKNVLITVRVEAVLLLKVVGVGTTHVVAAGGKEHKSSRTLSTRIRDG